MADTFNETIKTAKKTIGNGELSKLEALKVTQVLNSSKLGFTENAERQRSPFQIFLQEQLVRDLINGQSIFWAIKVMDWLLIPIWASIKREDLGLGFNNIQVGEITFYSFPGVLLLMLLGYGLMNITQEDWSVYTFKVFGAAVALTPIIGLFKFSEKITLSWLVLFECVKVSCYLIYSSAWSVLMNGFINGDILGRMYSFSFAFSHFSLILLFQMFPRLLSFMMSNRLTRKLGGLSVWLVFIVMAVPSIYGVKISIRARKLIQEKSGKFEELDSESVSTKNETQKSSEIETEL